MFGASQPGYFKAVSVVRRRVAVTTPYSSELTYPITMTSTLLSQWINAEALFPYSRDAVSTTSDDDSVTQYLNSSLNMTIRGKTDEGLPLIHALLIAIICGVFAIITAVGNVMVMISFKMDPQLQTVSNAFLLSLSMADFSVGIISMPLYTWMWITKHWPFGTLLCDIWLSIDYTMSNASVANLLIICFDRYLSITRPLTYRAKRTPNRAAVMISTAWIVSVLLWTPWIFAWPYIDGKRLVPENKCYVQFLETNSTITVLTAILAFYLPVAIMIVLYMHIYRETQKRHKDLKALQSGKNWGLAKNSDDEKGVVTLGLGEESADERPPLENGVNGRRVTNWRQRLADCCRIDRDQLQAEESSSSEPHPLPPSPAGQVYYPQCYTSTRSVDRRLKQKKNQRLLTRTTSDVVDSSFVSISLLSSNMHTEQSSISADSIQMTEVASLATSQLTIISNELTLQQQRNMRDKCPAITMISEESEEDNPLLDLNQALPSNKCGNGNSHHATPTKQSSEPAESLSPTLSCPAECDSVAPSRVGSLRRGVPLKVTTYRLVDKLKTQAARRKRQESRQERKAAKTLSAILLAFIVTWTPYNIFTVITANCWGCINPTLYAIGEPYSISNK